MVVGSKQKALFRVSLIVLVGLTIGLVVGSAHREFGKDEQRGEMQLEVNLGTFENGSVREIEVHNPLGESINFTQIVADCSCLKCWWANENKTITIEANGRAKLKCFIDVNAGEGKAFSRPLILKSSDGRLMRLLLTGFVDGREMPFAVSTKRLVFERDYKGEEILKIRSLKEDENFRLENIRLSLPFLVAEPMDASSIVVKAKKGVLVNGFFDGVITIDIVDSMNNIFEVTVPIGGSLGGDESLVGGVNHIMLSSERYTEKITMRTDGIDISQTVFSNNDLEQGLVVKVGDGEVVFSVDRERSDPLRGTVAFYRLGSPTDEIISIPVFFYAANRRL